MEEVNWPARRVNRRTAAMPVAWQVPAILVTLVAILMSSGNWTISGMTSLLW
ncbi:hypothetical protein [Streptomyces sp. NPDC050804]|uniref:hypothetical protein n=1 Tax=Streptomyces sp. NPDC050804 TaxID=3154745 RepID=UPI0034259E47